MNAGLNFNKLTFDKHVHKKTRSFFNGESIYGDK